MRLQSVLVRVCVQVFVALACQIVWAQAQMDAPQKPIPLPPSALSSGSGGPKQTAAKKIRVVFLNPASLAPEEVFWITCTNFMQAAANDLGIELTVLYANRSPATMYQQVKTALSGPSKPDFIVMQNMKKTAVAIIEEVHKSGVKVLLFNSGLSEEESRTHGAPREKHKNWIGQILPDDAGAGYQLAQIIVNEARDKGLAGKAGKIEMLALGGTVSDTSAIERNKGLVRFLQENRGGVVLNRGQALPGDWEESKAAGVFEAAFNDYPKTTVVWSANDNMAMGTLNRAKDKLSKVPGTDIIVGGIDWNPAALGAVKRGEMTATLGGHFMEGAWVMVMVHDYALGVDFATEGVALKSRLSQITKANMERFERALGDRAFEKIDKLDFVRFSKAANPALKVYPFHLDAILSQLK